MDQSAINIILGVSLGVAGALAGIFLKLILNTIKDLQRVDENLAKEVSHLNILIAGQYVKQEQFERFSTAIFSKLDRIEGKVDNKADKQ